MGRRAQHKEQTTNEFAVCWSIMQSFQALKENLSPAWVQRMMLPFLICHTGEDKLYLLIFSCCP